MCRKSRSRGVSKGVRQCQAKEPEPGTATALTAQEDTGNLQNGCQRWRVAGSGGYLPLRGSKLIINIRYVYKCVGHTGKQRTGALHYVLPEQPPDWSLESTGNEKVKREYASSLTKYL